MLSAKAILLTLMSINENNFSYGHLDVDEAYCLAEAVYYESRAENIEGQFAVAQATLSRVKDPLFPKTICGVVHNNLGSKGCAYSWSCDGKNENLELRNDIAAKAFITASVVSLMSMNNEIRDFCKGATFFYNPKAANPEWAKYYTKTCVIGNHIFLKREKGSTK